MKIDLGSHELLLLVAAIDMELGRLDVSGLRVVGPTMRMLREVRAKLTLALQAGMPEPTATGEFQTAAEARRMLVELRRCIPLLGGPKSEVAHARRMAEVECEAVRLEEQEERTR